MPADNLMLSPCTVRGIFQRLSEDPSVLEALSAPLPRRRVDTLLGGSSREAIIAIAEIVDPLLGEALEAFRERLAKSPMVARVGD